jgi:hypothetical protein
MADIAPVVKIFGGILGTLVASITAFFTLRRFYHWLRPIRITPRIKVVLDGSGPDQILATVTNVSGEDQVLVRCIARSTYPMTTILRRHFRHPLTPRKLYPTIWYAGVSFGLMGISPIRLSASQREELHHSLYDHPFCMFLSSMVQIEVELSTGRVFRSRRLEIPEKWRLKPPGATAAAKPMNA